MSNSTAALLDQWGDVVAEVRDAPAGNTIDIAGARTADGDPINVRTHKISRSQRNLKKAREIQLWGPSYVSKAGEVFSFEEVEDLSNVQR
jgi:hypothetical protein